MSTPRWMMDPEFEVYGYSYEYYNYDDEEDDHNYIPFDEYRNDVLYEDEDSASTSDEESDEEDDNNITYE
jgi:hypothetical protein